MMRDVVVSAGDWMAAAGSAAAIGAEAGNESLESEGFEAADAFHDGALRTGLVIDGVETSGASAAAAADTVVEAALKGTEDCATGRSAAATGLEPAAETDDESAAVCNAAVVGDVFAASTFDPSREGKQRTFSAAITSKSSFSV